MEINMFGDIFIHFLVGHGSARSEYNTVYQRVIARSNRHFCPLFRSTSIVGCTETCAIVESQVSNAYYAVGDCYACEAGATGESPFSDACYAVGNRYACEAATAPESVVSDAC